MLDGILDDILIVSPKPGEIRPDSPRVRPAGSLDIPEFSPNSPNSPSVDVLGEDRRHCRECLNLNGGGYCIRQRFRPVDDIPRKCEDFQGIPPAVDLATTPKPTSESEHNAAGRFFKWLITLSDGREFIAAAMPRRTLAETREQYPGAVAIEPIAGEDYQDE